MIYVFDFGSQYSQLIARRIRALGCEARLVSHQYPLQKLTDAKGIILSGGPDSVYEKEAASVSKKIFDLGVPVLGICYGMQLTCHVLGGKVQAGAKHEYGPAKLEVVGQSQLFKGIPKEHSVWMSHGDQVASLPKGFAQTGKSSNTLNAAMENAAKKLYG